MSNPRGHWLLRVGAGLLILIGLGVHLVLGTLIGLGLLAGGLALHLVAAVIGHRWLRGQSRVGRGRSEPPHRP